MRILDFIPDLDPVLISTLFKLGMVSESESVWIKATYSGF